MQLHIAVDLDDVTIDFIGGVRRAFEVEYGVDGIEEYSGAPWGQEVIDFYRHPMFLESGYEDWWGWLRDREWLWATFQAVPGAIGGIKRLRTAGHYVEAVTARPEWAEHNVWKWLGRWRPPFQRVTIVSRGASKLYFTDAHVIVDDRLDTCQEFVRAGRAGIWFNRGLQDQAHEAGEYLLEARNWEDVIAKVEVLEEVL